MVAVDAADEKALPRRANSIALLLYGGRSCSFSCLPVAFIIIAPLPRRLLPGLTDAGLPKSEPFGSLPHCQPGSLWPRSGMYIGGGNGGGGGSRALGIAIGLGRRLLTLMSGKSDIFQQVREWVFGPMRSSSSSSSSSPMIAQASSRRESYRNGASQAEKARQLPPPSSVARCVRLGVGAYC